MIPCQDTPAVKSSYSATVRYKMFFNNTTQYAHAQYFHFQFCDHVVSPQVSAPKEVTVVMSAVKDEADPTPDPNVQGRLYF